MKFQYDHAKNRSENLRNLIRDISTSSHLVRLQGIGQHVAKEKMTHLTQQGIQLNLKTCDLGKWCEASFGINIFH